ncbi:MAG: 50S ribosomal protein L11 methyltransferase [Pseudomonadota bacterium]
MPWIQLKIDSDKTHAEKLADLLSELGAAAVTLEDRADQPIFEPPPGATPLWQDVCVVGLFAAEADPRAIITQLERQSGLALVWQASPLEDKDWERAWMDNYHPIQFGPRLWICPSWSAPPDPSAINLMLDPGLAFGTGTHPTTALCMQWLDAHPPQDLEVIDFGCGSGILAIAALLLGAKHCVGVDIDPQALYASRMNAEKNAVADRLTLCLPPQAPRAPADLLIANILANPLIELASHFGTLVRPGGHLVLSGILREQAEQVSRAYQPHFEMQAPVIKEDWVRLEGRRKYDNVDANASR